ncbi:hypothetical protein H112_07625 [Trichophyton rubrum D6]|uniref:Uncharacterized protein n=1 Tax=Trichophyton rubrum CBS 288.86 TaxID=1215330 RepID=A0A022VSA8_TRIRU|nr:hypothetical protein H100_07650 [Trichophyton rubrum MR850]EZF38132.1 hypothetical protein H102_07614 [Trichophyton rubrum CBS 100081]EZF48819.1 hypothetical protein H103_07637 [Trichophyton rubrum CBS 288.86]EZF59405.1 hypothetical protein H104_07586 [Trichophyton rubrum CBS 289.86]EZF80741.1 hypothetical protein H110_07634 [Trichophyton rubrum MR1448]EZF91348.1 hypothetical protein H113_07694 [Trichophyton rubrum MR1459]EZG02408.1 hypothetical protein H106_07471 [Trichophyton rubrum CBS 
MDLTTPMRRRRLELASAVPIPSFAAGYMPSLGTPTGSGHDMLSGSRNARLKWKGNTASEALGPAGRLHDALSIPDLPLAACSPHSHPQISARIYQTSKQPREERE